MSFEDLKLAAPLLKAVAELGYTQPTPIQTKAIPHALTGADVLGCAQTGTGKTAAFALPILHRLMEIPAVAPGKIRVLVLSPTRELAAQIDESFRAYGRYTGLRFAVIFGGVNQNPQTDSLRKGVDVLVATPGRLLDLIEQRFVDLSGVQFLVLDEADRMLDMGFILDIRRIVALVPKARQTLFFSATMPPEIRRLADTILSRPVNVEAAPPATTAEKVNQSLYYVGGREKSILLAHLLSTLKYSRVLVFVKTKHGADRVVKQMRRWGISAEAIHGDKTQGARTRALENFKSLKTRILIATDIAARGLDIDDISHVINYDIPHEAETYVHRIGRTGRAGASGEAISFCSVEDFGSLSDIQRLVGRKIPELKANDPAYLERLQHPDRGVTPLPDLDDASEPVHAHRSRGARGQRARDRGPRRQRDARGHDSRDRDSRDRGRDREAAPPSAPSDGGDRSEPLDRESAYESASLDFFKPQRPESSPRARAKAKALPPVKPAQGLPRRSQG